MFVNPARARVTAFRKLNRQLSHLRDDVRVSHISECLEHSQLCDLEALKSDPQTARLARDPGENRPNCARSGARR